MRRFSSLRGDKRSRLILLIFFIAFAFVFAGEASSAPWRVDFAQCETNFRTLCTASHGADGGVTRNGDSVPSCYQAEGMNYPQCVKLCGQGWQPAKWKV